MLKGRFFVLCFLIFFLSACSSNSTKNFRSVEWGMTVDEVIKIEEKEGNKEYETNENDKTNFKVLEYPNVLVNGHKGSLKYIFENEVPVLQIGFIPEKDQSLVENEMVKLSNNLLTQAEYNFNDLNSNEMDKIRDMFISKYGEPTYSLNTFLSWHLDSFTLIYFEDKDNQFINVTYQAKFNSLKDKIKSTSE